MADSLTKEELKKEITAILKGADLSKASPKEVRQELETKLELDLTSRKKEILEIVQSIKDSDKKGKKPKKNGNKNDDDDDDDDKDDDEDKDEEEEEEEDDEDEDDTKKSKRGAPKKASKRKASSDESDDASEEKGSDEEYSPTKKAKGGKAGKKAGAKGRKKKGGSDSDSDEDWGKGKKGNAPKKGGSKRTGGGYNKACTLTPELAAVVGQDTMARHEVVKKVWSIIKEKNLYDPKNKQFAICNDDLMKVIGVKRFRTFGMMKYLKKHFVD